MVAFVGSPTGCSMLKAMAEVGNEPMVKTLANGSEDEDIFWNHSTVKFPVPKSKLLLWGMLK